MKRIQNAVNSQLQAKGLTLASDNPDFLIGMQVAGRTVDAGSVGVGASIGIPVGHAGSISLGTGRSRNTEKREGTLVLDFVSPADRVLIWHGSATGTVHPETPPEDQEKRINEAVAEILGNFPPPKK